MKTKAQISTLILVITLMFTLNTFAKTKNFAFEDEAYINDIPFNTEMVVNDLKLAAIDFEDEAYIDDIELDTERIANMYNYQKALEHNFILDEEVYVDDITFDTKAIVAVYNFNQALENEFNFSEELVVDDIPFDTMVIANDSNNNFSCYLADSTK